MSRDVVAPLFRGVTLWSAVTGALVVLPLALRSELATAHLLLGDGAAAGLAPAGFEAVLTAACAVALCACATWAWLVTTATLALAVAGSARRVPGCPDAVRRLVLTACGTAVVVVAVPAHADPAGSPPTPEPPRAQAPAQAPPETRGALPRPAPAPLVVRPGDSLWSLAASTLPPGATHAETDRSWRALWAANRAAVGPDPDLIHPGTRLHVPTDRSDRTDLTEGDR